MRNGRWSRVADYGEGSAGNAGWPEQPGWFGNSTHYGVIADGLKQAGFDGADVEKIMGQNWLRFFRESFSPA
jgi:microsomal dipeptidase-like Zn-dependent dipeptidase